MRRRARRRVYAVTRRARPSPPTGSAARRSAGIQRSTTPRSAMLHRVPPAGHEQRLAGRPRQPRPGGLMASHRYLRDPSSVGHQPLYRVTAKKAGAGALKFHALGCRVDGGAGLPPGRCEKCRDSIADGYFRSLMRIDRRAARLTDGRPPGRDRGRRRVVARLRRACAAAARRDRTALRRLRPHRARRPRPRPLGPLGRALPGRVPVRPDRARRLPPVPPSPPRHGRVCRVWRGRAGQEPRSWRQGRTQELASRLQRQARA